MPSLSYEQLASVALGAGVPKANAATAVAIAMAESGGNPNAHNAVPPDNSYGLWQINMLGSMGPARRKQFGLSSNDELFNPATNARAMFAISGGGKNWSPWTTYTRGTFMAFLPSARAAVGDVGTGAVVVPAGLADDTGLTAIRQAFETLTNPREWRRFGMFMAGWLLLVIALIKFSGTTGTVMDAAKKVVPIAKVAKVAKLVKR